MVLSLFFNIVMLTLFICKVVLCVILSILRVSLFVIVILRVVRVS